METDNGVDSKTLFAGLQSELGSRVVSRTSINTTHLQTIVVFVGAYVTARVVGNPSTEILPPLLSAIIPMVSLYFVLLYQHNDTQIGLLNRQLRRIEASSPSLMQAVKFYANEDAMKLSFVARKYTQWAVFLLCCVSPAIFVIEFISYATKGETSTSVEAFSRTTYVALIVVIIVTSINLSLLTRVQNLRDKLSADERTAG